MPPSLTPSEPNDEADFFSAKRYVVGFMFSPDLKRVALIRKNKPAWQRGKLNGIGGKLEFGESIFSAMVREFVEETGVQTSPESWRRFIEMSGGTNDDGGAFRIDFFVTTGDLSLLRTMESEPIEVVDLMTIYPGRRDMIENLPWLVGLALDHLEDGRPNFVIALYP